MSHRFRLIGMALPLAACAAMVGPVAGAQASNSTLLAAVKSASPKINDSQAKVLEGLATYQKTHSTTALTHAITAQDAVLKALQSTVSSQSASNANGVKAKADIVKGLGLIVNSNKILNKELVKSAKGAPVSTSRLKASVSADKRGNVDVNDGIKLLVKN